MATRRLAASTVEWAELARKIPEAQRASFLAMKGKSDGYVRTINALPEKLPTIDWAVYKNKITVPGMVDTFQKRYSELQVPYPMDTATANIEKQAVEQKAAFDKFVAESKTRVSAIAAEMAKWEELMPLEEMNLEEALEVVPHLVIDKNNPNFWPHEQEWDEWKAYVAELKKHGDDHH